jgi:lysophospholipase L1-like esterase
MFAENVKRAVLVFVSLLVAVLIIEGLLRFGGWGFYYLQDRENKKNELLTGIQLNRVQKKEFVILCVGESTTYMGYANSWPSQLQRILNNIQTQKTFRVINTGAPARQTSHLLSEFRQVWLDKYKPDFVLAMVGINDYFYELDRKNFGRVESLPTKTPLTQSRLTILLSNLRIYGLIQWIAEGIKARATGKINNGTTANVEEEDGSEGKLRVYGLVNPNVTHLHPDTVRNLNDMVNLATDRGINFFFVSYALRKIDILRNVIERDVFYISNYEIFQELLKHHNYDELFVDRFAEDFGHATPFGNRVIADNVARQLLKLLESQE